MSKIQDDIWTFTKTGFYHTNDYLDNQDVVYENTNDSIRFVAVADGVSTCENGKKGAEIACQAAFRALDAETEYLFSLKEKSVAYLIVKYIQSEIEAFALKTGADVLSYASTLSFLCVDRKKNQAIAFSLGDSAVAVVTNDKRVVPLGGVLDFSSNISCTVVTIKAYLDVKIAILPLDKISSIFIATDGAWKTILKNGKLHEEIIYCFGEKDTERLEMYFRNVQNADDCSCAFIVFAT